MLTLTLLQMARKSRILLLFFAATLPGFAVNLELFVIGDNAGNGCAPPVARNRFTSADATLAVWARIGDTGPNDKATVNWIAPDRQTFRQGALLPLDSGSSCRAWTLKMSDIPGARRPGRWTVELLVNGGLLWRFTFLIDQDAVVPSWMVMYRSAGSAGAQGCPSSPTPTTSFQTGDRTIHGLARLDGISVGDSVLLELLQPGGKAAASFPSQSQLAGQVCFTASMTASTFLPGIWWMRVTVNGSNISQIPFEVVDPNRRLGPSLRESVLSATDPSTCVAPPPQADFSVKDESAAPYFVVDNLIAGDVMEIRWISPRGQYVSSVVYAPIGKAGNYCAHKAFAIAGAAPASTPGLWRASVVVNRSEYGSLVVPILPENAPRLDSAAVVNGGSYVAGLPVVPGSQISIIGSGLADDDHIAEMLPLPTTLAGVQVLLDGRPIPIMEVRPDRIYAQIPWAAANDSARIQVVRNGIASRPATIRLAKFAPGLWTQEDDGRDLGTAIAYHCDANGGPRRDRPVTIFSPAVAGEKLAIFGTGFGPVSSAPADGDAVADGVNSWATVPVTVRMGGLRANVVSVTLDPIANSGNPYSSVYNVGLYRIVFQTPADVPVAADAPVQVFVGRRASNTVTIRTGGLFPTVRHSTLSSVSPKTAVPFGTILLSGSGFSPTARTAVRFTGPGFSYDAPAARVTSSSVQAIAPPFRTAGDFGSGSVTVRVIQTSGNDSFITNPVDLSITDLPAAPRAPGSVLALLLDAMRRSAGDMVAELNLRDQGASQPARTGGARADLLRYMDQLGQARAALNPMIASGAEAVPFGHLGGQPISLTRDTASTIDRLLLGIAQAQWQSSPDTPSLADFIPPPIAQFADAALGAPALRAYASGWKVAAAAGASAASTGPAPRAIAAASLAEWGISRRLGLDLSIDAIWNALLDSGSASAEGRIFLARLLGTVGSFLEGLGILAELINQQIADMWQSLTDGNNGPGYVPPPAIALPDSGNNGPIGYLTSEPPDAPVGSLPAEQGAGQITAGPGGGNSYRPPDSTPPVQVTGSLLCPDGSPMSDSNVDTCIGCAGAALDPCDLSPRGCHSNSCGGSTSGSSGPVSFGRGPGYDGEPVVAPGDHYYSGSYQDGSFRMRLPPKGGNGKTGTFTAYGPGSQPVGSFPGDTKNGPFSMNCQGGSCQTPRPPETGTGQTISNGLMNTIKLTGIIDADPGNALCSPRSGNIGSFTLTLSRPLSWFFDGSLEQDPAFPFSVGKLDANWSCNQFGDFLPFFGIRFTKGGASPGAYVLNLEAVYGLPNGGGPPCTPDSPLTIPVSATSLTFKYSGCGVRLIVNPTSPLCQSTTDNPFGALACLPSGLEGLSPLFTKTNIHVTFSSTAKAACYSGGEVDWSRSYADITLDAPLGNIVRHISPPPTIKSGTLHLACGGGIETSAVTGKFPGVTSWNFRLDADHFAFAFPGLGLAALRTVTVTGQEASIKFDGSAAVTHGEGLYLMDLNVSAIFQ